MPLARKPLVDEYKYELETPEGRKVFINCQKVTEDFYAGRSELAELYKRCEENNGRDIELPS